MRLFAAPRACVPAVHSTAAPSHISQDPTKQSRQQNHGSRAAASQHSQANGCDRLSTGPVGRMAGLQSWLGQVVNGDGDQAGLCPRLD